MLNSLYIKNFRNLEELTIESLGRVNLITGKNNTGKSSVLEAVALLVNKGSLPLLLGIIRSRGDFVHPNSTQLNIEEANTKTLSSIFTNRQIEFDNKNIIKIGETSDKGVILRFTKNTNQDIIKKENENSSNSHYNIGFEIYKEDDFSYEVPLTNNLEIPVRMGELPKFDFIASYQITKSNNGNLFDSIILTEKEQHVIDALKIIEPKTQRIAFVQENGSRKAVIKLSDNPDVLPLQSMGDGINRILTIILALVNCENGYLSIDEFENGLYHTVQDQLWKIILHLAEKLNIQVFATTHSWDCVEAFEEAVNSEESSSDGKLIRLEHKNGKIRPVEFRKSQLESATKFGIEIR